MANRIRVEKTDGSFTDRTVSDAELEALGNDPNRELITGDPAKDIAYDDLTVTSVFLVDPNQD